MRRIAQQRGAAERPARQRVAVAHRVFVERPGRADQRQRIDEIEAEPVAHERLHLVQSAWTVPILGSRRQAAAVADARHHRPVGQPALRRDGVRMDRIENEFLAHAAGDHHGAAIDIHRPVGRATPQHHAIPHRRALVRIEHRAQRGVNAIRPHQHVTLDHECVAQLAPLEPRHNAVAVIGERDQPTAGTHRILAQTIAHRLQQHAMQPAAMDRELRRVEPRVGAAQLAPHHLAEAVGVDQLARADAGTVERRQQSQVPPAP